jgi:hypothetical protein
MKTYYHEYAHDNHAKWLSELLKIAPSELGEKVANVLGYVGGGLYNCPIDINKIDWKNQMYIDIPWKEELANWDDSDLSRLWVLCHRNMLRVGIRADITKSEDHIDAVGEPYEVPTLILSFYQRNTREGSVMNRLPNCEDMIRDIDDDFKRDRL